MRKLLWQWFRVGWRVAFEDPTPKWKKRGTFATPGIWFDLALLISVVLLGLLNLV